MTRYRKAMPKKIKINFAISGKDATFAFPNRGVAQLV